MKRITRLTESDLTRIVKRVINEKLKYDPKKVVHKDDEYVVLDKDLDWKDEVRYDDDDVSYEDDEWMVIDLKESEDTELNDLKNELPEEEGTPDESKLNVLNSLKGFVGYNQTFKNVQAACKICEMQPYYKITGIKKIDELLSNFINKAKEIIFSKGRGKKRQLKNLKNIFKKEISNTNVNITESNRFLRRRILNEQPEQLAIAGGIILTIIIIALIMSRPRCMFNR